MTALFQKKNLNFLSKIVCKCMQTHSLHYIENKKYTIFYYFTKYENLSFLPFYIYCNVMILKHTNFGLNNISIVHLSKIEIKRKLSFTKRKTKSQVKFQLFFLLIFFFIFLILFLQNFLYLWIFLLFFFQLYFDFAFSSSSIYFHLFLYSFLWHFIPINIFSTFDFFHFFLFFNTKLHVFTVLCTS